MWSIVKIDFKKCFEVISKALPVFWDICFIVCVFFYHRFLNTSSPSFFSPLKAFFWSWQKGKLQFISEDFLSRRKVNVFWMQLKYFIINLRNYVVLRFLILGWTTPFLIVLWAMLLQWAWVTILEVSSKSRF